MQQTEARAGDEGARLGALRDVGLLDAEPDPALERLTRLAGELLGVPISLVSLVDAGRQYFAGATGLSVPFPARDAALALVLPPRGGAARATRG